MSDRIFVVDDDPNICQVVKLYLERENYDIATIHRGDEGLQAFKTDEPALVLLDIMMPGLDGWEVCKEIRKTSRVPIIMMTAKGETFDKVLGLELGADDYIAKPFDPKELVARVKAVLRRMQPVEEPQHELTFPGLIISMSEYVVTCGEQRIEMPPKEIELLYFLASHQGKVFTREQLLEQVWGFDYYGDSRTVDVHIKRIREKLPDNPDWHVKTIWGVGYKFEIMT